MAGGGLGIAGTLLGLDPGADHEIRIPWSFPGGEFHVAVDPLSTVFLLPVFLIGLLGAVYGLGYWKPVEHPDNGRKLRLFYGLMTAAMALVILARNAVLFLVAWEVMALAAFFLVITEDDERPVRAASWLYLAATHAATLCLFALFALLRGAAGTFDLAAPPEEAPSPGLAAAVFLLAVAGFALKAGLMPLHVWLPDAHASAPSHVSALMIAVMPVMPRDASRDAGGRFSLRRAAQSIPTKTAPSRRQRRPRSEYPRPRPDRVADLQPHRRLRQRQRPGRAADERQLHRGGR